MANKLYEENDIAAIATAIRAKNGSSNTYTVSQMAPAINNLPSGGGGDIVNGIIRNYKAATSTIDANTFVEFVNFIGEDNDSQILRNGQSDDAQAVLIDTNKVFITHKPNGGTGLYCTVCTISGTTITVGTSTMISASSGSTYTGASTTVLEANKVFVVHSRSSYAYGVVCTISGTTITVGTDIQLSTDSYSNYYMAATTLTSSKVFVSHRGSSYLYGVVCTISGTTITIGTDIQLTTTTSTYSDANSIALDSSKVFVIYPVSYKLTGAVCSISGTTITIGSGYTLSNENYSTRDNAMVLLDTNKVFIAHGDSYPRFRGVVCTFSGSTITAGTDTLLSTERNTTDVYAHLSAVKVSAGKVFVAHATRDNLYGALCSVSGTTITKMYDRPLTDKSIASQTFQYSSCILLENNKVFVSHRDSSSINAMILTLFDETRVGSSNTMIEGVTKTACTTGGTGQVWVLNN